MPLTNTLYKTKTVPLSPSYSRPLPPPHSPPHTLPHSPPHSPPCMVILLIGDTNAGKSVVVSDYASREKVEPDTEEKGWGLMHTTPTAVFVEPRGFDIDEATVDTALSSISDALLHIGFVNQILYVVNGQMDQRQLKHLVKLQEVFSQKIGSFTSVIRTHFSDFMDSSKVEKEKEYIKQSVPCVFEITKEFLYVDNDPKKPEVIEESAKRIHDFVMKFRHQTFKCNLNLHAISSVEAVRPETVEKREGQEERKEEEAERPPESKKRKIDEVEEAQDGECVRSRQHVMQQAQEKQIKDLVAAQRQIIRRNVLTFVIRSPSTSKFIKVSGSGRYDVRGGKLTLNGNWEIWQAGTRFGSNFQEVTADVYDLDLAGTTKIHGGTWRNLNVGGNVIFC